MNKYTKLVLSVIGLSAIIIPALFLVYLSSKSQKTQEVSYGTSNTRSLDTKNVQETVKRTQPSPVVIFPSPITATPSATPSQLPGGLTTPYPTPTESNQ